MDEPKMSSEFNEAALQIFRLNELYTRAHAQRAKGQFNGWNITLDSIETELDPDKKRSDLKDVYQNRIDTINSLMNKRNIKRGIIYRLLADKEKLLRKLQDDCGKGSKRGHKFEAMM